MTNQRRRVAALATACVAVVFASLLGSFVVMARPLTAPVAVAAPAPSPTPTENGDTCGKVDVPHYYAQDPGKESPNAFGPSATRRTVKELSDELILRLCGDYSRNLGGDSRLLSALRSVAFGDSPNQDYTSEEWLLSLTDLMRRAEWPGASAVNQPALKSVYTLLMVPNGRQPVVELTRISEPPSQYLMLPVLRSDGTTVHLMLRAACGFQPVIAYDLPLPLSWRQLR